MVEVAVPTIGKIHFRVVWELLKLTKYDVTFQISAGGEGQGENRNRIVRNFLLGNADYLLMIDDDTVPLNLELDDLVDLGLDIIAIPCPIKLGDEYKWNVFAEKERLVTERGSGLKKVFAAGTGCILIKRCVLEGMDNPFTPIRAKDDGVAKAEDYAFCERANGLGFTVWAYWDQVCGHYKDINLEELI